MPGYPLVIYDDNSNLLTIEGVKNEQSGAYINNAVVTVTLKDRDRKNLAGTTWPVTLSYVTASNGNYSGTVASTIKYPVGEFGLCIVQITASGGAAEFDFDCVYSVRKKADSG